MSLLHPFFIVISEQPPSDLDPATSTKYQIRSTDTSKKGAIQTTLFDFAKSASSMSISSDINNPESSTFRWEYVITGYDHCINMECIHT